jgi:hypothetical protein
MSNQQKTTVMLLIASGAVIVLFVFLFLHMGRMDHASFAAGVASRQANTSQANTTIADYGSLFDDAALLQANATVIAGILIFLTISPLATPAVRYSNLHIISTYGTLGILTISVLLISFPIRPEEARHIFQAVARLLFLSGLFGVIITVSFFIQRAEKRQKVKTLNEAALGASHGFVPHA